MEERHESTFGLEEKGILVLLERVATNPVHFGVIRPTWDVAGGNAQRPEGHYLYDPTDGLCMPARKPWAGSEGAEAGDRIGLLLDLDAGCLTVFKNQKRLGVMAEGLTGEFVWAATLLYAGDSVRIASAPVPGSE